ncbi:glycosyl transferase family 2 [Thalassoporum mexicanum PCC 7367]|uniref:glycosyltransferase n=1 Tax=Thalassoporum mexicanum TaxID=3457544 RepID=UPI00029FB411|nr:glycosyltransferase [Pseudanabaena sp. PCC 7367]AFY68803.1 glycosyl transferase family 2 [Pseudanabaena sp. PCC 7367]
MSLGVSIVICCYNGEARLPTTLQHLVAQQVDAAIDWEVILVDNASSDRTTAVAIETWAAANVQAPLITVNEPQPGQTHARLKGIATAKYDLVSFVDDDNWVSPNWIQTVVEIMQNHPEVGACGGQNSAVAEVELPTWFADYQCDYAVGTQADTAGDVTDTRGFLWGAGLTMRKRAWQQLHDRGFEPINGGRAGQILTSCDDYEFCQALILAGWRLWYDPRLHLSHFMSPNRLQWSYLKRLKRGFGASSVGLDAYKIAKQSRNWFYSFLSRLWLVRMIVVLLKLLGHGGKLIDRNSDQQEGDRQSIEIEILRGRLMGLWYSRNIYKQNLQKVLKADWRNRNQQPSL